MLQTLYCGLHRLTFIFGLMGEITSRPAMVARFESAFTLSILPKEVAKSIYALFAKYIRIYTTIQKDQSNRISFLVLAIEKNFKLLGKAYCRRSNIPYIAIDSELIDLFLCKVTSRHIADPF